MKREEDIKKVLIENAIQLIAEGGFEKATTKALTFHRAETLDFKMNEVYIYRIFGSKEQLYEAAFEELEYELYYALRKCVTEELTGERELMESWYHVYERAWNFMLRNEARCRCFIRYYYSVYFRGNSLASHNEHFTKVVDIFTDMFIAEADVPAIMHSVFGTLLNFAVRCYNGALPNVEENRIHIFNVLYNMFKDYLKDDTARNASFIKKVKEDRVGHNV